MTILNAEFILDNHGPEEEIPMGGAADLMSDVLAFGAEGMALLTRDPSPYRTTYPSLPLLCP